MSFIVAILYMPAVGELAIAEAMAIPFTVELAIAVGIAMLNAGLVIVMLVTPAIFIPAIFGILIPSRGRDFTVDILCVAFLRSLLDTKIGVQNFGQ